MTSGALMICKGWELSAFKSSNWEFFTDLLFEIDAIQRERARNDGERHKVAIG